MIVNIFIWWLSGVSQLNQYPQCFLLPEFGSHRVKSPMPWHRENNKLWHRNTEARISSVSNMKIGNTKDIWIYNQSKQECFSYFTWYKYCYSKYFQTPSPWPGKWPLVTKMKSMQKNSKFCKYSLGVQVFMYRGSKYFMWNI